MSTSDTAVRIRDLVKAYRRPDGSGMFNAVDGISLDVRAGEILAVLGPNGAGKTTTLEIVEGLTAATSGTATVLGLDSRRDRDELKQRIGVQLQSSTYFEHLRLDEILRLFGSFYRRQRDPDELLDLVGLHDKRRALVGQLSGGQAQRFSIVAALVNAPAVVFLDEPTSGLDPQSRRNLWELVRAVNAEGTTVILTTHSMEEAEALADRVAIVDMGRLVALDTAPGLIASLPVSHTVQFTLPVAVDVEDLRRLPGVAEVRARLNGQAIYDLAVDRPQETVPALFAWADGLDLRDVRIGAATLEDVFLARTGNRLRD
jgi:ABC-2 type transport system ATP-binding protein